MTPAGLTDREQAAFRTCLSENLRLEQERLPQEFVNRLLETVIAADPHAA